MTAAELPHGDAGAAFEKLEAGRVEAIADTRSTGEVGQAVLAELGYGPKVRRERTDLDHVQALVETGGTWPPITVTGPTGHIIDGHHRASAARRLGWSTIPAVAVEVDIRSPEARELASKPNNEHGLPFTLAERKSNAKWFLENSEFSDQRIADASGLNRKTVANLRPRNMTERDKLRGSLGRDGKARPSPTEAAERREAAARELDEKPTASDREVAQRTGLSPRTVADVRKRNESGEDPVPSRLRAVPDPKPEPPAEPEPRVAVKDVLPSVPTDWLRHPAANRTNETRLFMRFMNRWGRVSKFQKERQGQLRNCPLDAREEAIRNARWMAQQWSTFAADLEKQPTVEVTE